MLDQVEPLKQKILVMQNELIAKSTEIQVLNQTLGEIMTANVQLRTGMLLIENKSRELVQTLATKEKECAELNAKLNPLPVDNGIPAIIPDNGQ